jgi:hypothetical protein
LVFTFDYTPCVLPLLLSCATFFSRLIEGSFISFWETAMARVRSTAHP